MGQERTEAEHAWRVLRSAVNMYCRWALHLSASCERVAHEDVMDFAPAQVNERRVPNTSTGDASLFLLIRSASLKMHRRCDHPRELTQPRNAVPKCDAFDKNTGALPYALLRFGKTRALFSLCVPIARSVTQISFGHLPLALRANFGDQCHRSGNWGTARTDFKAVLNLPIVPQCSDSSYLHSGAARDAPSMNCVFNPDL